MPAFSALVKAYASGLFERTREISPDFITPDFCASIKACKLVPPPETKTAIFFLFIIAHLR
jgi:hypothetical protein